MQDVEPDMEDLFRRAAEYLPLKDEDNWQQVAGRLSAQAGMPYPALPEKKSRRKYLVLIFLLLFLLTASWWIIYYGQPEVLTSVPGKEFQNIPADHQNIIEEPGNSKNLTTKIADGLQAKDRGNKVFSPEKRYGDAAGDISQLAATATNGSQTASDHAAALYSHSARSDSGIAGARLPSDHLVKETAYNSRKTQAFAFKGPEVVTRTAIVSEQAKDPLQQTASGSRFYFGVLAGPGFNRVQSHEVNKTGFEAGLLGGYRLSRKLHFETGIYFSKNFYEAKAVSFNQKGIEPMLTGGRELNEVHGSNFLLKLPILLRYNFTTGSNNKLFASAGFSSFMVTRESNWYLTTMNGNNELLYGEYNTRRLYFAGAVNISAGYEKKIGGRNSLRIQPYLQLPLQGVGVGNLRLMSTGLHLGFTRSGE